MFLFIIFLKRTMKSLVLSWFFIASIHAYRISPHQLFPRAEDTCGDSDYSQLVIKERERERGGVVVWFF